MSRHAPLDRWMTALVRAAWGAAIVGGCLGPAVDAADRPAARILKSTPAASEERLFWPQMTLVLEGALPNTNPKLGKNLKLTFGRLESPDGVKWREFVLGFSVLYERGHRVSHSSFRDSEGRLVEVSDDGAQCHLVVEMDIAECCYGVKGGKARYVIDVKAEPVKGDSEPEHADSGTGRLRARLAGTFTGEMVRPDCTVAGPGGKLPCQGPVTGTLGAAPWPSPVETWTPLKPNEHPRLIFRKSDLAALRARAETPEGKTILSRLESGLGGNYSLCQAAGHGFLYQLTGDRQHADRAKQAVDKALAGAPDKDGRYSWASPGGKMRAGPSFAAIATAYDLCFDAWDEAYRKDLARKIQEKVHPGLIYETGGGQHNPHSNHYGAWKGGAGVALLAVTGDDGVDQEVVSRSLRHIEGCIRRCLKVGFSERAYFYEGHYCGRISCNTGLVPYLQAARVAAGQDWIHNSSAAQWLLTQWIFELYRRGGEIKSHMEGMYARPWGRSGGIGSGGGDFCQGFGILPDAHKPAVLYFYNHVLEPGPAKTYDVFPNPLRGAYSFVNWPMGIAERHPADVLGIALWDRTQGRAILRNAWDGENDIVCFMSGSMTIRAPGVETRCNGIGATTSYFKSEPGSRTCVASSARASLAVDFTGACGAPALFVHVNRPAPPPGTAESEGDQLRRLIAKKPSAGRVSESGAKSFAADAAPKGGRPKAAKPKDDDEPEERPAPSPDGSPGAGEKVVPLKARHVEIDFGTIAYSVLTLHPGDPPPIKAEGEGTDGRVIVGKRVVRFDGEKIVLGE